METVLFGLRNDSKAILLVPKETLTPADMYDMVYGMASSTRARAEGVKERIEQKQKLDELLSSVCVFRTLTEVEYSALKGLLVPRGEHTAQANKIAEFHENGVDSRSKGLDDFYSVMKDIMTTLKGVKRPDRQKAASPVVTAIENEMKEITSWQFPTTLAEAIVKMEATKAELEQKEADRIAAEKAADEEAAKAVAEAETLAKAAEDAKAAAEKAAEDAKAAQAVAEATKIAVEATPRNRRRKGGNGQPADQTPAEAADTPPSDHPVGVGTF